MNTAFRNLPPTAAPASRDDLAAALRATEDAPEKFATALAGYLGVWACYPTASGRAALALLLNQAKQEAYPERDEIIMPAYTCPALAQVTIDAGLQLRPVDVIPETLAMDDAALLAAATPRTMAIIHVHPFGLPLGMEAARQAVEATGAVLIEDAAQALGARTTLAEHGQTAVRAGAAADIGLISLGPGKPLSTGGGGALAVSSPESASTLEKAWREMPEGSNLASAAGLIASRAALTPAGWSLAARLGARRYGESASGMHYRFARISPLAAAVGLRSLSRLDAANAHRQVNALALAEQIKELDILDLPSPAPGSTPIYLRLPVVFRDAELRDRAYEALTAAGLGAGRMYTRTVASKFPTLGGPFPGAEALAARLLTLPTHAYVTEEDIARIAETLRGL